MTAEDILESVIDECRDDHVGLWRIVNAVRHDLHAAGGPETKTATLGIVRRLLDRDGMFVGQPTADGRGFAAWNLSAEKALQRIEREWSSLGRDPDIGEVAWFTACQ